MVRISKRRLAPYGLYLSLAALVVSAGIYIVQRAWTLPLQISLGTVVVGLALFVFLDPQQVRVWLTGRQARYGSNSLIMSLAFIGILVVVNYLAFENSTRWDLTEDQRFTLAPETLDTIDSLPGKVSAQAFFTQRIPSDSAKSLLDQFQYNSDGQFEYTFIDPEANPVAAQQANITRDGTVVFKMGDQQEQVTIATEKEFSEALLRLINPEARTVYFLTGHGEYNPEETGERSYSFIKSSLESKNYTVKILNLLAANAVPEDATIIVIGGPQKPVSAPEVDLLKAYLDAGGSLVVMEEPLPLTEYGDDADPLADFLEADWGIALGEDVVVDQTSTQPFAPYAAQYGNSPITQKMQGFTSQFPTARSVKAGSAVTGISQVELVLTDPQSWAETDLESLLAGEAEIVFNEGQDFAGPVPLAVVAENLQTNSRVVVFGDSDFPSNANYRFYGNGDLFVNSIDWAAQMEELISLTPKQSTQRLFMPPQQITMNLILLGSVFILPGIMLASGVSVWIQRRKRG